MQPGFPVARPSVPSPLSGSPWPGISRPRVWEASLPPPLDLRDFARLPDRESQQTACPAGLAMASLRPALLCLLLCLQGSLAAGMWG